MRSYDELQRLWADGPTPPIGAGALRMIVARLGDGRHDVLEEGTLDVDLGLVGDRWSRDEDRKLDSQVTVICAQALDVIAGDNPKHLCGDNLVVDLDISEAALPVGARLRVGEAELEVTPEPHTGCKKFSARFGAEALRWVNHKDNRALRLRGLNCRVVTGGVVRPGDAIAVIRDAARSVG